MPPAIHAALRYGRVATLIAGVVTAVVLRLLGAELTVALGAIFLFALGGLLAMALLSRRYGSMLHCTTYCSLGLSVNILGKLSPWRIRINREACDGCGACERVCAYRAITPQSRENGTTLLRCSLCRDCVNACPHGAIHIHGCFMPKAVSHYVFVGLLVLLHIIFFMTARVQ